MCLDQLKKFKIPVYGYKIFRQDKTTDELFRIYQGNCRKYKINKILNEKYFRNDYNCKEKLIHNVYPYGFHIFKTLKSAKYKLEFMQSTCSNYAIYKVEIIEPHTTGVEYNMYCCSPVQVIVSKKMRIIHRMPIKIIFDNTI